MVRYIIITFFILLGGVLAFGAYKQLNKTTADSILDFMMENPNKFALKLIFDDELIAEVAADRMMPLASTVKIIIAIEYAEQVDAGEVKADEKVMISDLDKFYVANTDGGAHMAWLKEVDDQIKDETITIQEVAKGMIKYSSNANTEWLIHRLGIDKINTRLKLLGMQDHSDISYIVSALFVGKEKFPKLKGDELAVAIAEMDELEYARTLKSIHDKLINDTDYKLEIGDLGMEVQRVWSDRLPASTVAEYAGLMSKFNSRAYFAGSVQATLDDIMQWIFDYPGNREVYKYFGMKGGSTAFVLTQAMYVTDLSGHKTELAYFFDDLNFVENMKLQSGLNDFHIQVINNPEFRNKLRTVLSTSK